MSHGLLIVDVQNDFCSGGSLAVPGGEEVARPLSRLASVVADTGGVVIASRDWHPPDSHHFREGGGTWPAHCERETEGAAFHPDLHLPPGAIVISKGVRPDEDGYSAFEGRDGRGRPLDELLDDANVEKLYVGGLATDHCVRASVLDALAEGFEVYLLADAIRAVDLLPGDGERAVEEMKAAGAVPTTTKWVEAEIELSGRGGATGDEPNDSHARST